jgi:hypothetical protein
VKDEGLHKKGDRLLLEAGTLVHAEKEALLPVTERRAHQDDLKQKAGMRPPPWTLGRHSGRNLRSTPPRHSV